MCVCVCVCVCVCIRGQCTQETLGNVNMHQGETDLGFIFS